LKPHGQKRLSTPGSGLDRGRSEIERTHLPNYAEYADEKYHEKPQSALRDHWGNMEYAHAGKSAKWAHQKRGQKLQKRGTHPIVENNTDTKEK
jgi:hypothetical protein